MIVYFNETNNITKKNIILILIFLMTQKTIFIMKKVVV